MVASDPPQLLDSPELGALVERLLPLFPQTEQPIATTVEQWGADLAHDTLDRLGGTSAPTLVVAGEQDLLTPVRQGQQVADRVSGARHELFVGPGSRHALNVERAEKLLPMALDFLGQQRVA